MTQVDRKTAREQYVAGKSIVVFDMGVEERDREIIELSCRRDIKPQSKVRYFNSIVKTFSDYVGTTSFWLGTIEEVEA